MNLQTVRLLQATASSLFVPPKMRILFMLMGVLHFDGKCKGKIPGVSPKRLANALAVRPARSSRARNVTKVAKGG